MIVRRRDQECEAQDLTPEQNSSLARDLREHRRADMAFASRARDQLAELLDARPLPLDPVVDRAVELGAAAARQEIDPKLFEVAREAGGQQPLPLIGGNEARDLLLRPVEAERFAKPGISARDGELVDLAARGERGDAEHAVELVEAHQAADDVLARAERDQAVAPGGGLVANFGRG